MSDRRGVARRVARTAGIVIESLVVTVLGAYLLASAMMVVLLLDGSVDPGAITVAEIAGPLGLLTALCGPLVVLIALATDDLPARPVRRIARAWARPSPQAT